MTARMKCGGYVRTPPPGLAERSPFAVPVAEPLVLALLALLALLFAAMPCSLRGQDSTESRFPVRVLDRPSTLPRGTVRLDGFALVTRAPPDGTSSMAILGGGVGVIDRLEIGGQLIPVTLNPLVQYANPSVYAIYGGTIGAADFVPTVQAVLPLRSGDPFIVDVGATLTFTFGEWGSLTAAPTLSLNARQEGNGSSLSIPITLLRQAGDLFSLQLASGVGLSRFDPRDQLSRRPDPLDFNDITVPVSATLGYTLIHGSPRLPLADLSLQWQWPQLYTRVPGQRGSHLDDWAVQLQTSWYLVR